MHLVMNHLHPPQLIIEYNHQNYPLTNEMKTSSCTLCIQHCTLHNTTRREGSKEGHADFFPFVEIRSDEYFRFSLAGFHVRLRLDDIANLLGRAWVPVIEVSVAQLLENLLSCQRARAALVNSAKLVL